MDLNYCTVNGSLGGPTSAHESVFNDELVHELSASECRFYDVVRGPSINAQDCRFYNDLRSNSGWVVDSTIEGQWA
ncbi:hypothetical protein D8S78_10660 [Natrialba swarupiae]|nr:hypothetical protein [Natrialba swarupiae]